MESAIPPLPSSKENEKVDGKEEGAVLATDLDGSSWAANTIAMQNQMENTATISQRCSAKGKDDKSIQKNV